MVKKTTHRRSRRINAGIADIIKLLKLIETNRIFSQQQIAEKLCVTRGTVARLMNLAKKDYQVVIIFHRNLAIPYKVDSWGILRKDLLFVSGAPSTTHKAK